MKATNNPKKNFGTRKKGVAVKHPNKHRSVKPYNKQGR